MIDPKPLKTRNLQTPNPKPPKPKPFCYQIFAEARLGGADKAAEAPCLLHTARCLELRELQGLGSGSSGLGCGFSGLRTLVFEHRVLVFGLGLPSKAERDGFVAPGAASAVDASRRIIKTCRLRSAPYGIQMGLETL